MTKEETQDYISERVTGHLERFSRCSIEDLGSSMAQDDLKGALDLVKACMEGCACRACFEEDKCQLCGRNPMGVFCNNGDCVGRSKVGVYGYEDTVGLNEPEDE